MGPSSTATQRSSTSNDETPAHISSYNILITRATNFLAANDIESSQRVARLLLRSPDLSCAHQITCYEILSHRPENGVYHTAQAMTVQSLKKDAAKVVNILPRSPLPNLPHLPRSPRSPRSPRLPGKPSLKRTPRVSIQKDDEWITTPSKPSARAPKTVKRVTFAEPFDPVKENMKKPKVGKLFPELKAMFEGK